MAKVTEVKHFAFACPQQ